MSAPIAPFDRSQSRILLLSITERNRKVVVAGPITARMRGSVRKGRTLLRTGEMASSRNCGVQVLNVFSKKLRTAGFRTLLRMILRYAASVRKRGRFQSEVGEGCSIRA